jgi:hypothetical protein
MKQDRERALVILKVEEMAGKRHKHHFHSRIYFIYDPSLHNTATVSNNKQEIKA